MPQVRVYALQSFCEVRMKVLQDFPEYLGCRNRRASYEVDLKNDIQERHIDPR